MHISGGQRDPEPRVDPAVTIAEEGLIFNLAAALALGRPEKVMVGIACGYPILVVRPAAADEIWSFNLKHRRTQVRINSMPLARQILEHLGGDRRLPQRFPARYDADGGALLVDLDSPLGRGEPEPSSNDRVRVGMRQIEHNVIWFMSTVPVCWVTLTARGLVLSAEAAGILGRPEYVLIGLDEAEKVLVVAAAAGPEGAFCVRYGSSPVVNWRGLARVLRPHLPAGAVLPLRFEARWDAERDAVVVDLSTGEPSPGRRGVMTIVRGTGGGSRGGADSS
jgi:hypothetical protein